MDNLVAMLRELQAKRERFRQDGLKETPTRTIFIDPLLGALGWEVRDPDEVQLEYPTVDGKSVDYALKINQKPILLVEAKALNDPLTDVKDVTQTTGYAANDGIVWCILTNGVRWRVYRSVEQCPAPEKLMFEVSYAPGEMEGMSLESVADQFRRFSRDAMAKGTLDAMGEQTFTDGKIRKALRQLVANPTPVLVKPVRRAANDETLRPRAIKESLARVLSPLLSEVHRERVPQATEGKLSVRVLAARKAVATRRARGPVRYSKEHHVSGQPREVLELYEQLDQFCIGLKPGQIERTYLAKHIAYRHGKRTFCCVHLQRGGMRVWLKLKLQRLANPPSFARDVSGVGHWGTGDLELAITNASQLQEAEDLIRQSLEGVEKGS